MVDIITIPDGDMDWGDKLRTNLDNLNTALTSKFELPVGGIVESQLSSAVTTKLNSSKAATATKLATFGDSMTSADQGGYSVWGALLSEWLGLELFNPSQSGERTSNIALRQGGFRPRFTVPGGVIPAGTEWFTVNLAESYTNGFNSGTTEGNIGTFSDVTFMGVPVRLRFLNGAWTMARQVAASSPVPVASRGDVVVDVKSRAWREAVQIYFGGFNGGDQKLDVALMKKNLLAPYRFLALGMVTGQSGSNPAAYEAANESLRLAFPDNYFDVTNYLVANGLADEGITPTAQDLTDIAARIVPTSLRRAAADPHLNAAGNRALARRLAEELIARGWVDGTNAIVPPRRGQLTNLTLALKPGSARATGPTPTALRDAEVISVRAINVRPATVTSPLSYRNIVSRWHDDIGSFQFLLSGSGDLFMQDANGNYGTDAGSTPFKDGAISARLDIDRAAGTSSTYFSQNGGATWQLVKTVTNRSTANLLGGRSGPTTLGHNGYASIDGFMDRLTIMSAPTGGSVLLDVDFTTDNATVDSWSMLSGASVVPK